MYATYHFKSADEISSDILEAIKIAFKSRPITIVVEDSESDFYLSEDMKAILDERLQEDENTYLNAKDSLERLNSKYGL